MCGDLKADDEDGVASRETVALFGDRRTERLPLCRGERRIAIRGNVLGVLGRPGGGCRGDG